MSAEVFAFALVAGINLGLILGAAIIAVALIIVVLRPSVLDRKTAGTGPK